MKLNGALNIGGYITVEIRRKDGTIENVTIHNTVTNTGKDSAAGLIGGLKSTGFTYFGIGTSAVAIAAADTGLGAEVSGGSLARASSTVTQITTDVANDTLQLLHSFSATATYTIQEAGVFDTATGGVMLAGGAFAAKALEDGDELILKYSLDID
ncbi:MAG: phage tail fiber protein [Candidatus Heimdallarchaeaceae archaeon]